MRVNQNRMLKEDERHIRGYLPMNCYLFDVQNKEQILHTHWHTEWEFFYVANGRIMFQLNDENFVLEAGEVAFIPPEQIHAGFAIDHASCNFEALVFHSNLLAGPEFDVVFQRYISPILDGNVNLPKNLRRRCIGRLKSSDTYTAS